ncbi:MAG TPA: energy transducer TonB [Bacteroidales bacterium]|nr:energy transducer TonB [Bacteroidales bacterium]HPT11258.1 energy transducer TonB [Bacteroidales bacterium]
MRSRNLLRLFLVMALCFNLSFAFGQKKDKALNSKYLFIDDAELYVYFPGATDGASSEKLFLKFINDNLKYPEVAIENALTDKVVASFIIGKNGSISHIRIERCAFPVLGKEVIRVLSLMPAWEWDKRVSKKDRRKTKRLVPVYFTLT